MTRSVLLGLSLFFASLPATTNYQLNSYGFGSGGTANTSTATYSLEGNSGELAGQPTATSNDATRPGFVQTEQANVPQITLDTSGGLYYNKIHFVINQTNTLNNPSDATFLVAVSPDNFTTTYYLQPDGTLSSTLNTSDYQTRTSFGGNSGSYIIGLTPGTQYYVKVRATQGKFTESAYSPIQTITTAAETLTFTLQTSSGPTPPYTVGFSSLTAGTVFPSLQTINTTFTTNGASGGNIYVTGQNGGLFSTSQGHKINSVTGDLDSLADGFGAQNTSVSQSSGGPYSVVSPYNVSGCNMTSCNVGVINSTTQSLYTSANPVTSGNGALSLFAKAASTDVAASDYQEVLTFTAAANF